MTDAEFHEHLRRLSAYRRKHDRLQPQIAPDGKRWVWLNRWGRWAQIDLAKSDAPKFIGSKALCEGRNRRRKSFGYRDQYSMRERGWPYAIHHGNPY